MKRILGYVALVLGLTLVFLAPFLLIYTVPRVEKAPTDTDQVVVSNGSGSYFSPKQLKLVGPTPLQNIEVLKGDPAKSSKTVAVIDYTSHLVDRSTGGSVDFDKEVYAMNRNTGVAENCCGEFPKMSGETLKFPFGTKKQTYPLWDPSANKSFPVNYVRTEDLSGVSAYVFEGTSPDTNIGTLDLPNSLVHVTGQGTTTEQRMYREHTIVWIEPETGQVLKGDKQLEQWAADSSGTKVLELANLRVTYSDATVATFVDQANQNVKQLKLVKLWLPLVGGILGLILALVGLFVLRDRPRAADEEPKPTAAAA